MSVWTNEHGQIVCDTGIGWQGDDRSGYWSRQPREYRIERIPPGMSGSDIIAESHGIIDVRWTLFRWQQSSMSNTRTRHVITRGTVAWCMQVAEIYEIMRAR